MTNSNPIEHHLSLIQTNNDLADSYGLFRIANALERIADQMEGARPATPAPTSETQPEIEINEADISRPNWDEATSVIDLEHARRWVAEAVNPSRYLGVAKPGEIYRAYLAESRTQRPMAINCPKWFGDILRDVHGAPVIGPSALLGARRRGYRVGANYVNEIGTSHWDRLDGEATSATIEGETWVVTS